VAEQFGVEGMPSSVFVDREGKVRYVHRGYKPGDEAEYAEMIRSLVKE
jgi:thioredoxin-related protein